MKPVAIKELEKCDGHMIFSDSRAGSPDPDITDLHVPDQPQKPGEPGWLYHRNMVGLLPAWSHMLQNNVEQKYDWLINVELDHIVRPTQIRLGIENYMRILKSGTPSERESVGKPMILWWGNAFLFNYQMVKEMKRQWSFLGQVMSKDSAAPGCPAWMNGRTFCPPECSQDIVYPNMVRVMEEPQPALYVNRNWGDPEQVSPFPPMIWDMLQAPSSKPGITQEMHFQNVIREIAKQPPLTRPPVAAFSNVVTTNITHSLMGGNSYVEQHKWVIGYPGRDIALIHHVGYPSVHALAQELLPL